MSGTNRRPMKFVLTVERDGGDVDDKDGPAVFAWIGEMTEESYRDFKEVINRSGVRAERYSVGTNTIRDGANEDWHWRAIRHTIEAFRSHIRKAYNA